MQEIKNTILLGDCRLRLKNLEDNSVDAVVTDPPYELGFMGKDWDASGVAYNVDVWREVFRVLKPGGHLLSFGGTRTYHRMACAIEDAGFEIRDQMQWIYGSGFPKNMDVSKAIDSFLGAERDVVGFRKGQGNIPNDRGNWGIKSNELVEVTEPATDEAREWDGWGTALKPANEPIVLARKPIAEKTIAQNVLKYGTGALNIDGTRIGEAGRWPANVILDDEAGAILDEQTGTLTSGVPSQGQSKSTKNTFGEYENRSTVGYGDSGGASRFFYCAKPSKKERNAGLEDREAKIVNDGRKSSIDNPYQRGDTERLNVHPTVKPIKLMEYLVKLVTPKNGLVLDPFSGSGTTLIAAKNLGMNYIGIEMEPEYVDIANKRLSFNEHTSTLNKFITE